MYIAGERETAGAYRILCKFDGQLSDIRERRPGAMYVCVYLLRGRRTMRANAFFIAPGILCFCCCQSAYVHSIREQLRGRIWNFLLLIFDLHLHRTSGTRLCTVLYVCVSASDFIADNWCRARARPRRSAFWWTSYGLHGVFVRLFF